MSPTRKQIQDKITEIRNNPEFSTLREEIDKKISEWLEKIECPAESKEKILDDLGSYSNY